MKIKLFCFLLILIINIPLTAEGENVFTLHQFRGMKTDTISVNELFSDYSVISPFTGKQCLTGLCVDAVVTSTKPDYFVRVLLKDKDNNQYVVMERYPELNDSLSFNLSNYCEETALLNEIHPDSIIIYTQNASLLLKSIQLSYMEDGALSDSDMKSFHIKEIKKRQAGQIIDKINSYNRTHGKIWIAGMREIALLGFSDKMRLLGFPHNRPTGGLEYYVAGVFEMGDFSEGYPPVRTDYVSSFDWRNRHGKNWMTPVRHQGNSSYCSAFSAVAALEAMANLYYNQSLNYDLSEQEAACCNGWHHPDLYNCGMPVDSPIVYIVKSGVCDELSYPFYDNGNQDCRSGEITPQNIVKPTGYHTITGNWDDIKEAIINEGVLMSGYGNNFGGHAMALVGYGTVDEGDTFSYYNNGVFTQTVPIDYRDPRIGQPYWIFKNSYGLDHEWEHSGYMYLMFSNRNYMDGPFAYDLPITTWDKTENDIIWEDADGDGYYFWGLGPKPSNCPYWVPNVPDGDDDNIFAGAMNNYGETAIIGYHYPIVNVNGSETYADSCGLLRNISVNSGGVLTITGEVVNCKMTVKSGGTLVIDGGRLLHADIELEPSSTLRIINGGLLHMKPDLFFSAPLGSFVEIEEGEVS